LSKKEGLLSALGKVNLANTTNRSILVTIIFLAVAPIIIPRSMAMDILIFGLLALSYGIIQGHIGQVSFGHVALFGAGAYTTGMLLYYVDIPSSAAWIFLLAGVAAGGGLALGMGAIVLRRRGAYFALVNLALLQMIYFIVLQMKGLTGGDDGIWNIPRPTFGAASVTPESLYYLYFVIFLVCLFLIKRMFLDSPNALVLHAIKQDEARAQSLGYNVFGQMLKAYTISGLFAGAAGAMYAIHMQYIGMTYIHWSLNGALIIMAMLGGVSTFIGPLLGAAIFLALKDVVSMYTVHWQLIIGILVVVLILGMREGILGRIKSLRF